MRLYSFGNMYLQGIHAGIQTAHSISEMFSKYNINKNDTHNQDDALWAWSDYSKTIIVLNGGMQTNLEDLITLFGSVNNPYPWAYFNESQEALNGAITNVSIILPEIIYNAAAYIRNNQILLGDTVSLQTLDGKFVSSDLVAPNTKWVKFDEFQTELFKRLNSCRLMG